VSDTQQQDQAVEAVAEEPDRREARERAYQDVSLRAVELLAKAQKAADEAVAEAQSYARDLEETAREQYRHILQRAHEAARASGEEDDALDPDGEALVAAGAPASALETKQLEYVRTYARVAHSQLKAVLGALNDELDRLADLAEGPENATRASGTEARAAEDPAEVDVAQDDVEDDDGDGQPSGKQRGRKR
jgi:hypothetical protein